MSEGAPPFDAARLIADVRARNPEALAQAYLMTFGTDLGRLVLADHLVECGVGRPFGLDAREYQVGMHDGALHLAAKAGYDPAAHAVAVLTDNLEGKTSDATFVHGQPDLDHSLFDD